MSRRDYLPDELVPGTVYKVVRLIGAGGMGTVYDVEDTTIGKRYVLKTLHPELGDRQDLARRMQAEARALARLHHPNIVDVVTAGVTQDAMKLPYYVMERLNGQSVRFVLQKKGQLELPHAIHIAIDLLDALDHAHDKGVVHRDVKPDNIFLHRTAAGVTVTKLLDFGIMTVLDSGKSGETGGRFLGTLRYAAPEQLRGDKPTPKMDLYAAGLVLYEMLAGRGPFDDESDPQKVAASHLHREAPLVSTFAPVPDSIAELVRASLAKDPDARPRDAFTFAKELRGFKRSQSMRPGESTENRATAPAVLSAMIDSPRPVIHLQDGLGQPSPISPLAQSQHADPIAGMPKTTMRGMTPPTLSGGTLENAPPSFVQAIGATLPSIDGGPALPSPVAHPPYAAVDRAAPTHSLALETPRMPRHGTDPLAPIVAAHAPHAAAPDQSAPAPQLRSAAPTAYGAYGLPAHASQSPQHAPMQGGGAASTPPPPIQWPAEGPPHERSESGQSRTVASGVHAPPKSRVGLLVAIAVMATGLAAVASVALWHAMSRPATTTNAASPSSSTSHDTSSPPVVSESAPVLAPPGLDDPGKIDFKPAPSALASSAANTATDATDAGARAKPAPTPARIAPTNVAPPPKPIAPVQTQPPAPAPAPKPPDRPGPGF